ncbi:MATE family efflux transporter [Psychromonas sp.]|nr:MATE family efflux transporter [Psychromonas sp.]
MLLTAKFTQGSISEHIVKMALTNAIGLSVFFVVDLFDIYFISLLNQPHLVSAIGYALAILFFCSSFSIAMMIANSAVVAKSLGEKQNQDAKKIASTCILITLTSSLIITFTIFLNTSEILTLIGAIGEERTAALQYLNIIIFSFPIVAVAMQMTATLRALGKAKLAMFCMLMGGITNLIFTPLFIFYLPLSIEGVAWASFISRVVTLVFGSYYLLVKCQFKSRISFSDFKINTLKILHIAAPASLTQVVTPISHLYITYEMAKFGSDFVAGWTVISRIIPVAFIMLFAMPGSIGPIISQNLGANNVIRVKATLNHSLNLIIKYVFVLALTLSLLQDHLISLFNTHANATILLRFFCQYVSISFIFVAVNLVAMSFLNNIGRPKMASMLNVGKLLLGTIPLVSVCAYYYGAPGILVGQALSSIIFAIISMAICYQTLAKLNK